MHFVDTTSTVHNFLRRAKPHFLRQSIFKLTEFVDQLMIFHIIFLSCNLREYSPGIEQSRISYFFSFKYINAVGASRALDPIRGIELLHRPNVFGMH